MYVLLARVATQGVVILAVTMLGLGTAVCTRPYRAVLQGVSNGRTPDQIVAAFEGHTGLAYGTDTDFAEAAATIAGQTGLSTFVSLASFGLIVFLCQPTRFFAAWTRPTGDRRPTVLVAALVVAFGVAFVPVLSDYFCLTGPAAPVFTTVLPALVMWFGALTAAYRFRLLDRVLGLGALP